MRIDIRGNVGLSPALEHYVQRRLQTALGRFSRRLPSVTVRLIDENGPRGGVDKRCQLVLTMPPVTSMMVEDSHVDVYNAVDAVADRAVRAVTRELGRRRSRRTLAAELRLAEKTGAYSRRAS
jgi:ribosomal subunit interface protein